MAQESETPAWLSKLGETYSQVHFGPGVVGKTSRATIGLIVLWGLIIWRISPDLIMNSFLVAGGLVMTGIFWWWMRKTHEFAEKHPDVALLEGAQLIEYQKWEAEVNGHVIPKLPIIPDPTRRIGALQGQEKSE